jgi:hypothetical protein
VGDGRVARHIHHYLTLLGLSVRTWSRRANLEEPTAALASCRTVLLLIQDKAIDPFIQAWPALREKRLVHFSGSLVTEAAEAAHPLMTFGRDLYELATYRSIPFVLDAGGTRFDALLPDLPNPSFTVPAVERPYYHALCVMAGNFSTMLWLKLFNELEDRFGIPASAAHPYLTQLTANLLADPSHALTGPIARGDDKTIAANLKALEGDPFHAIYLAFARAYDRRS